MAVEISISGGQTCCMNISASIETFITVADLLGWTAQQAAVPA